MAASPPDRREVRPFVSHNLELRAYPTGTVPSDPPGEHIMAATALAWLCDITVDRWGESWAHTGTIDLRFRSHLDAGLPLELIGTHSDTCVDLAVQTADAPERPFVTGSAAPVGAPPIPMPDGTGPTVAVAPTGVGLDGLVLRPIVFTFVAERDLQLARHLPGGQFWLELGWAHPGWFATAANAVTRTSIEFDPRTWMYAGVRIDLHAPVADGAALTIGGRVAELFDTHRHRFARCELATHVDGRPVASMRTTFVYGAADTASDD